MEKLETVLNYAFNIDSSIQEKLNKLNAVRDGISGHVSAPPPRSLLKAKTGIKAELLLFSMINNVVCID